MKLKRGRVVIDTQGNRGVVVKIVPGFDTENHGTVYVWQMDRMDYGSDNCEHYCEFGWEKSLKIIE
jgi:hypothetical protein